MLDPQEIDFSCFIWMFWTPSLRYARIQNCLGCSGSYTVPIILNLHILSHTVNRKKTPFCPWTAIKLWQKLSNIPHFYCEAAPCISIYINSGVISGNMALCETQANAGACGLLLLGGQRCCFCYRQKYFLVLWHLHEHGGGGRQTQNNVQCSNEHLCLHSWQCRPPLVCDKRSIANLQTILYWNILASIIPITREKVESTERVVRLDWPLHQKSH